MKNRILTLLLALTSVVVSFNLYGFTWENHDVTVEKSKTVGETTHLVLSDESGHVFSVVYKGDLSDESGIKIIELNTIFRGWRYVDIDKIDFWVEQHVIKITFVPERFVFQKVNLKPYVPAGLKFVYDKHLSCGFRVVKNGVFVKFDNRFFTEEELSRTILEAIKDPLFFIERRDPNYFYRQLKLLKRKNQQLRNKLNTLQKSHETLLYGILVLRSSGMLGTNLISKKLIRLVVTNKKANPKLSTGELEKIAVKNGMKVSEKEISLILSLYFNEFD